MFANTENYEDINKYFSHTYIKFKEEGEKAFLVTSVNSDTLIAEDHTGDVIGIDLNEGYELDYILPRKTVFQYGECAAILSRIPARMWKKGMDTKNTSFFILDSNGRWKMASLTFSIIDGFVNKASYVSLERFLEGGFDSAALNPRISISSNGNVFVDNVRVGTHNKVKGNFLIKKIYIPEIEKVIVGHKIRGS